MSDEASRRELGKKMMETIMDAMRPQVKFVRLREGVPDPPSYATPHAAGADLRSAAELIIPPGGTRLVPTGYAIALPEGYEGQVRPRSGLALRNGITVLNSPGTIDSDYRGELMVMLINLSSYPYEVGVGDRIAQLVVAPAPQVRFVEVEELDETERGEGGFGSTGD